MRRRVASRWADARLRREPPISELGGSVYITTVRNQIARTSSAWVSRAGSVSNSRRWPSSSERNPVDSIALWLSGERSNPGLRRRTARQQAPSVGRLDPLRAIAPVGAGQQRAAERQGHGHAGFGSGDIDARDVKAQEAAEGCAEYERPQEHRQYR
jgi:hypothetical protein